jgi:hypothetical protein
VAPLVAEKRILADAGSQAEIGAARVEASRAQTIEDSFTMSAAISDLQATAAVDLQSIAAGGCCCVRPLSTLTNKSADVAELARRYISEALFLRE